LRPFGADGVFVPTVEGGGVRRQAVRSAAVTVLSSVLGVPLQIVSTVEMARLLDPKDFGLVAMVITFSVLLMNFGLNGFTEVVLQWEKMDRYLASNLFWLNVGVGSALTMGFAASGPLIARFYHTPQVAKVCVGISLTILFTSISVVHLALLKRALRFTVTSTNDIITNSISIGIAIMLATKHWHWGYWALVAGAVARPLLQSIGAWHLCRWIPSAPRRGVGTGPAIRFAMNIYGRFSVNYFARNMDNLLVGWKFGPISLGYYKKAYDLFLFSASALISPLTNVAVSALSRFDRHSAQFRRYLLNSLGVTAFVGMAMGAALTLSGREVIRLVLGPKWEMAGPIFTYFGPGVGIMLLYGTIGWIHLSIGTPERWFRWVIAEFSVTGLLFLIGLRWGPAGVAMAWTVSFWILAAPAFWYAGRPINLGVGAVAGAVWRYIVASAMAGYVTYLLIPRMLGWLPLHGWPLALSRILIICSVCTILYVAAVIALYRGFAPLYQIGNLIRDMAPRGWFPDRAVEAVATGKTDAGPADAIPERENQLV
jgi:PST family polysaccharide transporter